jgi:hypothetical protein
MKRNKYGLITLVILVFLMTGCGLMDVQKEKETETEKESLSMIPALDEKAALALRSEAIAKYYSVFHDGGEACGEPSDDRLANDEYYYYFCNDLDSLEKIEEALHPFFTKDLASELVNSYPIKEIDGKLAFSPFDVGSMLNWDKATGTLKNEQMDVNVYAFVVPDLDGVTETIEIEFVYSENNGWKINTDPINLL